MEYKIAKRFFWKGNKPNKVNLSMSNEMYQALLKLEEVTGQKMPDIMSEALEQFLVEMVKQGLIEAPEDVNSKKPAHAAKSASTSTK